jgi:hypothetical protein
MVSKGMVTLLIIVDAGPNVVTIFVIVVSTRLVDVARG